MLAAKVKEVGMDKFIYGKVDTTTVLKNDNKSFGGILVKTPR